jgi:hypothetical protein
VVNVTRLGTDAVSCATELPETSVVEHSVGVTITVVVKRVVNLETVLALSEASVTVEVEHVVEAAGESVISVQLKVEFAAAGSVVVVGSVSEKASPSGMLIPGMSVASGVLVTVGRLVESVPVSTALVVAVAPNVLETSSSSPSLWLWLSGEASPLIPPFAPVSPIQAWASSGAAHEMVVPDIVGSEKHCRLSGQGVTSQSFSGEQTAKFPPIQAFSPALQGSWTVTDSNCLLACWASWPFLR